VKGFALMLLIGTVVSLVTAVAATRAMLGLLADFHWFDNPSFMGAGGAQRGRWLQIDFMGKRFLWLTISGVVVAICVVAIAVKGLNLGIDFRGGTQIQFKTEKYVPIDDVRAQMRAIGHRSAVIQGRGSSQGSSFKNFQIRTESLTLPQQNTIQADIQGKLGAESIGIKSVSSSFSHQIARLAILAILVSLALIVFYIAIRFDFKYAVPVLVALAHDIVITIGIYALT
jgi:SecD/SecF fusion protein